MDEKRFKNQILIYSLVIAGISWIISLIFLRWNAHFLYGLLLGTFVSFVNLNILVFLSKLVLKKQKPVLASLGLILRLCIYGYVFYMALKVSTLSALACVIGFLTQKIAIYYMYGFKAKYSTGRKVPPEIQAEYEKEDREKEKSGKFF